MSESSSVVVAVNPQQSLDLSAQVSRSQIGRYVVEANGMLDGFDVYDQVPKHSSPLRAATIENPYSWQYVQNLIDADPTSLALPHWQNTPQGNTYVILWLPWPMSVDYVLVKWDGYQVMNNYGNVQTSYPSMPAALDVFDVAMNTWWNAFTGSTPPGPSPMYQRVSFTKRVISGFRVWGYRKHSGTPSDYMSQYTRVFDVYVEDLFYKPTAKTLLPRPGTVGPILRGEIVDTGKKTPTGWYFVWDTQRHPYPLGDPPPENTDYELSGGHYFTAPVGSYGVGIYEKEVVLPRGINYYRFGTTNDIGGVWGGERAVLVG